MAPATLPAPAKDILFVCISEFFRNIQNCR